MLSLIGPGRRELLGQRPWRSLGFAGVTAIDSNVAAVTVSVVEPLMPSTTSP